MPARATCKPWGCNTIARTNLGCRCQVPGKKCHRGLSSRGHHFFLGQLNSSSCGHREGRQSQHKQLRLAVAPNCPPSGHRGEHLALTCKAPRSAGFPRWPSHPAADTPGCARPPAHPQLCHSGTRWWLYLPLCHPALQPRGILLTSSFSSKKLKALLIATVIFCKAIQLFLVSGSCFSYPPLTPLSSITPWACNPEHPNFSLHPPPQELLQQGEVFSPLLGTPQPADVCNELLQNKNGVFY